LAPASLLLALFVPLGASTASAQSPPPPAIVAFVDVSLVPMDAERVLPHRVVVVEEGVVVAVGPLGEVEVPHDAVRIDGRGRWLMPGLADLHVHLFSTTDLLLYVANGVTTVRNLGGYGAADSVLALRGRIASGEILGPTVFTSGNWLDGSPPIRDINTVVTTPEAARREVDAQARAGFDFVKVYETLTREVYAAILDEAARVGIPVTGHAPPAVGLEGVLESGQVELAHAAMILRSIGWDADSASMARVADRVARAGVAVTATLSMAELAFRQAGNPDEIARVADRPINRYVPPDRRDFWRHQNMFAGMPRRADPDLRTRAVRRLVRALHEAGVPVLAGTDSDVGGQVPGFSIHDELRNLVASGLSPYEALRTATAEPHSFLAGVLPDVQPFATIEVGRRADLLLLEADPLADVAHVEQRAGVMVAGRWLPESELKTRLDALAGSYRN
jgi:imidazolonepropionase-like amidohydrolase